MILNLEDNDERIAAFQRAVASLGTDLELKVWRDARSMCAECEAFFPSAALISLDHDLNTMPGVTTDPGAGLDAAQCLGDFPPVCPVLLHSSNADRVWSMHNELRFSGWIVDRVGPLGTDWIEKSWLQRVREMLAEQPTTWKMDLPADHAARVERMRLSLDALALGDALGEMLSYRADIRRLYGLDTDHAKVAGERLLCDRRLAERGVRFVLVYPSGLSAWDSHQELKDNHEKLCANVDLPIAGLLHDLKQRGLMEDVLVVCCTEFGRTPGLEQRGAGKDGRDHHTHGFTIWLAGRASSAAPSTARPSNSATVPSATAIT